MKAPGVVAAVTLCSLAAAAAADKGTASKPRDEVDVEKLKADMVVLHDGKGHYLALLPYTEQEMTFYGDGKDLYKQRVFSTYASEGDGKSSRRIWAPVSTQQGSDIELSDGKWTVRCSDRVTTMIPLGEAEARKVLARAVFRKPYWQRQAYALGRDSSGVYYYVDKIRDDRSWGEQAEDPNPPTGYRLYIGRRGRMKPQKLLDDAVDSKGVVLSIRKADLAVDMAGQHMTFTRSGKEKELTFLPVEDNAVLIYRDLGLYKRLGIPCDNM